MASISKRNLPSGKPQWRVSFIDHNGNRKRPGFSSWKQADRFRKDVERQLDDGTYRADADRITITEACEAFLRDREGRVRRNDITRKMCVVYRGHINNHILQSAYGIKSRKLSQFSKGNVCGFRDALRDNGVSVVTTRKIVATLHAVLEFAIESEWVATNVAHKVKVKGPRDEGAKKIRAPAKCDLRAIIDSAPADLRLKIMFAAFTGLRASEQWGLTWKHLDLDVGEVHVEQRIDSYGEVGPPKSKAGVRTVPLSSVLVHMLKGHRLRSRFSQPYDYVFTNSKGRHVCHDNLVKRHFKPALIEAHVANVNWHCLRHFAVSSWIEQELAPKTVQTFAGHSSLTVTMDRYGHLFPSDDHKTAMDAVAENLLA